MPPKSDANMYCLSCKKRTPNTDVKYTKSKKGVRQKRAKCTKCGAKKCQFVSMS